MDHRGRLRLPGKEELESVKNGKKLGDVYWCGWVTHHKKIKNGKMNRRKT